jgi:hypothetical protein
MDRLVNAEPAADTHWYASVDSTGWLAMVRALLVGSCLVAKAMCLDRRSVVVHCSDGWDRTSQVVALTEILMDPHYRTMEGLRVVVEREWEWFGHLFQSRCGESLSLGRDILGLGLWSAVECSGVEVVGFSAAASAEGGWGDGSVGVGVCVCWVAVVASDEWRWGCWRYC